MYVCVLHMTMYVYICRYIYPTSSGVMCLDIHPAHPHLLAIGLYDGSVCVYDLRQEGTDPVFRSTAKTGKHTDPVWQVLYSLSTIHPLLNCAFISFFSTY